MHVFGRVEFTQLAADYKAVNLGQGFPDFSPPSFIQEAFRNALTGGFRMHQYTRAFVRDYKCFSIHNDLSTTTMLVKFY